MELDHSRIKIGKNAKNNWQFLDESTSYDLFFHLSKFPSCYVIYKTEEDEIVENDIIKEIAIICKNNTKYKFLKDIKVDYTFCGNVKKGEKVGEIYFLSNKKVKQIKL
jgi:predicted ribosome quality control (RQC) complex YloA/Tae2 family protein